MDEMTARVKKWGSSLGLVIPAPLARRNGLSAGDSVRVRLEPLRIRVQDLTGFLKEELKGLDLDALDRELASDWDDD